MNDTDLEDLDTQPPPLNVKCTDTDCEKNLHCFLKKRGMKTDVGTCRQCGADLIEWERIHQRNADDVAFTFKSMRFEKMRHHMWHVPFDAVALEKAKKYGLQKIRAKIVPRLRASIGRPKGAWDGRQTPKEGNVIYYAQHATATCCRKCLEYWHNIPEDIPLSDSLLEYCECLVSEYLDQRLQGRISEEPSLVPQGSRRALPKRK